MRVWEFVQLHTTAENFFSSPPVLPKMHIGSQIFEGNQAKLETQKVENRSGYQHFDVEFDDSEKVTRATEQ